MVTQAAGAAMDVASIDAAIEAVLQAERAARDAVTRCETEAESRVALAREQARRIAERAARRIAQVHAFAQETLLTRLAEIERARSALDESTLALVATPDHLRARVAQLAAELTSEAP